jgi:hypothetical protein
MPLARSAILAAVLALVACSAPRGVLVQHSPASPQPGSIEAFVPEAERFVQSHRGLKFKAPVTVHHLSDQAFSQRIVQLQRRDRASTDRQAKVLRALGLIGPAVDAEKAEEDLLGAGVIGFYDPKTKELEVRGATATLHVKHIVVHELTHALQDQWFSIDTSSNSGNDDADIAYTALVEGDAVRIEDQYLSSLSPKDRQDLQRQEADSGGTPPANVPRVLIELLGFPYSVGPKFAQALLQARGQKGLDDAFRSRPRSSSEVLHPDRFLNGPGPVTVAEPAAGGAVFDRGTVGELGLDLLLEDLARNGALSPAQARAATTGWAGDRYVAWAQGDGYCLRDRLAAQTAEDAAALTTALQRLAASRPGMTVEVGAGPVLTSCG